MKCAHELAIQGWSDQIQRLTRSELLSLYDEYAKGESTGGVDRSADHEQIDLWPASAGSLGGSDHG